MNEFISEVRRDWAVTVVWVSLLASIATVNLIAGPAAAYIGKRMRSRDAKEGVVRKLMMILSVLLAALFDGVFPPVVIFGLSCNLACFACAWWISCEAMSLVENWGMLGLPLPPRSKLAMRALQDHLNSIIPDSLPAHGDAKEANPGV